MLSMNIIKIYLYMFFHVCGICNSLKVKKNMFCAKLYNSNLPLTPPVIFVEIIESLLNVKTINSHEILNYPLHNDI